MLLANFPLGEFGGTALSPTEFDEVTMVEVVIRGEKKKKKSHPYVPRTWRWVGTAREQVLVNVIDKEEEFNFRLYVYIPRGTSTFSLFTVCNQEIVLSRRATLDHLAIAMATVVSLTLLPSKTESNDGMALCSP